LVARSSKNRWGRHGQGGQPGVVPQGLDLGRQGFDGHGAQFVAREHLAAAHDDGLVGHLEFERRVAQIIMQPLQDLLGGQDHLPADDARGVP